MTLTLKALLADNKKKQTLENISIGKIHYRRQALELLEFNLVVMVTDRVFSYPAFFILLSRWE